MGRRFHIPEIRYFSLSASLEMPEENPNKKITGNEVRLTGINFRPESDLISAQKWLNHFCEKGIMVKDGTPHAPIYFLK